MAHLRLKIGDKVIFDRDVNNVVFKYAWGIIFKILFLFLALIVWTINSLTKMPFLIAFVLTLFTMLVIRIVTILISN